MVFTKIINRTNVLWFRIGPTLFIICIIDLKPIRSTNYTTKYVNDSNLLEPGKYEVDLSEEV